MNKFETFAKAFKKSQFSEGEQLELYGNTYTVLNSDEKYTLLKDMKGTPCAYPTKALKKMLMNKSLKKAHDKQSEESGGRFYNGRIRVDKNDINGDLQSFWVDAMHGTRHETHSSKADEDQLDEISARLHGKMNKMINEHADAEDVGDLKEMLEDYIKSKASHSHLQQAHDQLAKEQGKVPDSVLKNVAAKQDTADNKLMKFKEALKASKKKKLSKETENE